MSETRQNRFEIDLDEIERQLRRSADMPAVGEPVVAPAPAPPPSPVRPGAASPVMGAGFGTDPLADLARIVGQDDPFVGILGATNPQPGKADPEPDPDPAPEPVSAPRLDGIPSPFADLTAEDRSILGAAPIVTRPPSRSTGLRSETRPEPRPEPRFDPVSEAYGEGSRSIDDDEFQPLPPQRSRGRLFAVVGVLVLAVAGTAGAFVWRNGGRGFVSSGPPPLIKADNAPVKVAPQNPGGMEIPDQSKQIYERAQEPARSQVLDRQEQPLDVREAARQLPPAPPRTVPADPAPTGPSPRIPALPETALAPSAATPAGPGARSAQPNAVTSALGEPRRVRTVSVRPDGTAFPADGTRVPSESAPASIPTTGLPPPVVVPTISVPANPAPVVAGLPSDAGRPVGPAVQVLPPPRPGAAGQGVASLSADPSPVVTEPAAPSDAEPPVGPVVVVQPPRRPAGLGRQASGEGGADATAAASGTFAVQISTRSTEAEARTAYTELSDRFANDLNGLPATVTRAEVGGRAVYRVRVTPLARGDADDLCNRIKAGGGACFVVAN